MQANIENSWYTSYSMRYKGLNTWNTATWHTIVTQTHLHAQNSNFASCFIFPSIHLFKPIPSGLRITTRLSNFSTIQNVHSNPHNEKSGLKFQLSKCLQNGHSNLKFWLTSYPRSIKIFITDTNKSLWKCKCGDILSVNVLDLVIKMSSFVTASHQFNHFHESPHT